MTDRAYRPVGCLTCLTCLVFWLGVIYMAWWGWGKLTHQLGQEQAVVLLDRYEVSVEFEIDGETREAGVSERSHNSALFYWYNPKNYEVLFKMVDACEPFGQAWVFTSAASSVTHRISVADQNTGQEHTYVMQKDENGDMFPIIDTERWKCDAAR
jgi:hypothetical protein